MQFRKYTQAQLIEAVATSTSMAQVLQKLNVIPAGGNYQTLRTYVRKLNLDTSHFTGQGWNKGKVYGPKRPIEDYLDNQHPIKSDSLKKRLFKEGYFDRACMCCLNTKWLGDPIPLELDHVDGDHLNNSLDNLRILCPNCHTLTPTYRGNNRGISNQFS